MHTGMDGLPLIFAQIPESTSPRQVVRLLCYISTGRAGNQKLLHRVVFAEDRRERTTSAGKFPRPAGPDQASVKTCQVDTRDINEIDGFDDRGRQRKALLVGCQLFLVSPYPSGSLLSSHSHKQEAVAIYSPRASNGCLPAAPAQAT